MSDFEKDRLQLVVKDNDLIQKARYNLTLNQQKIIAYIISKIKPTDKELERYEISISDFCLLCGIDKEHFYTEIKDIIDNLDSKSFWIETDEKIFKFRWFSEVDILKGKGKIRILLNSNIKKYLIDLSRNFTKYELYNILALKGKYSVRLYELFKSYSFLSIKTFDINDLKEILSATHYSNFKDFRNRVLTKSISEINEYTDLKVSFSLEYSGKKVTKITFYIHQKEYSNKKESYYSTIESLNKSNNQLEGQLNIFDYIKEIEE